MQNTPVSFLFVNSCYNDEYQKWLGEVHVRVGNDGVEYSDANAIVKNGIVDGGIFATSPVESGEFFTIRRDGASPETDDVKMYIYEIRIYECQSLFHLY